MNDRGMERRKEDGPAAEESRACGSIPIVCTYRTQRRRLLGVSDLPARSIPSVPCLSCVLSIPASVFPETFLVYGRLLRRDIEPRGSLNPDVKLSRWVKPLVHPLVKSLSRNCQLMEQRTPRALYKSSAGSVSQAHKRHEWR